MVVFLNLTHELTRDGRAERELRAFLAPALKAFTLLTRLVYSCALF
jgi:hypothetical protein